MPLISFQVAWLEAIADNCSIETEHAFYNEIEGPATAYYGEVEKHVPVFVKGLWEPTTASP